ncbi:MAG: proline--tRNA ligase [Nanoarchaeota archaeon]
MAKEETKVGMTVKKSEDFSEWYQQLIIKSELADYTKVSGCIVFRPWSYAIWEKLRDEVNSRIKAMGVKNAYFPLLIPESLLTREKEHLEGFTPEVAWVTHAGDTKLDEKLAIRPTSETIMYDSYSKWIRSWRDLPLKLNQWNSVIRWEFKHSVPFLRTREFLWNEGHTVFATKEEAEKEAMDILEMYYDVLGKTMALPGLKGKKVKLETFAGAEYTMSVELYLPNGKAIQGPDSHHDGQIFAKAYDIKFLDKEGKEQYAYQNTWAITTRMLGVMFAIHSDDKGLVLPPAMAPNKIVIVPIIFKDKEKEVMDASRKLVKELAEFDALLDDRDIYSAGWKFNEWELKGVPLRVELGPRDLQNKQVVVVRRDTCEKVTVKMSDLKKKIPEILEDMHDNLYKKAEKLLHDNILEVESWKDFMKGIENQKIVVAPWCEDNECLDNIKHKSGGAKSLNMPFEQKLKKNAVCAHCGKKAKTICRFGKSY